MKYILDTNICIYLIKQRPEKVKQRFTSQNPGDIFISSITAAELYYGAEKSSRREENIVALQEFFQPLVILNFETEDAVSYGLIRHRLEKVGKPVGAMDMLIAAQALSREYVLVTNSEKEFRRIEGLIVENWAK